jgi:hypothetical protein
MKIKMLPKIMSCAIAILTFFTFSHPLSMASSQTMPTELEDFQFTGETIQTTELEDFQFACKTIQTNNFARPQTRWDLQQGFLVVAQQQARIGACFPQVLFSTSETNRLNPLYKLAGVNDWSGYLPKWLAECDGCYVVFPPTFLGRNEIEISMIKNGQTIYTTAQGKETRDFFHKNPKVLKIADGLTAFFDDDDFLSTVLSKLSVEQKEHIKCLFWAPNMIIEEPVLQAHVKQLHALVSKIEQLEEARNSSNYSNS